MTHDADDLLRRLPARNVPHAEHCPGGTAGHLPGRGEK
jgi:hypothetical protein